MTQSRSAIVAALTLVLGCSGGEAGRMTEPLGSAGTPAGTGFAGDSGSSGVAGTVGAAGGSAGGPATAGGAGVAASPSMGNAGMGNAGSAGVAGNAGAAGSPSPSGPTFTRVWNEVLVTKGCSGAFCHGAGQGGLAMGERAQAYANLVGVAAAGPSCGGSAKLRVQPGDPEASLLLEKIASPTPSCGDPMPIGTRFAPDCLVDDPSVCTTPEELQLVRDWIAAGALDD